MKADVGFDNLWLIFAFIVLYSWVLMAVGNRIRGVRIENPEDHHNAKAALAHAVPLLAFLIVSVVTPIVLGSLFLIGSILLVIAGTIYTLSIAAFVKAKRGLTTMGIYRFSRNPMYVAWILAFGGFTSMAWQFDLGMGIITACITVMNAFVIHRMVLGEERFLSGKYDAAYHDYIENTPRYLGILKNRKRNG